MSKRILIVEDQFLIALNIEDAVLALGHHVVAIAGSTLEVERVNDTIDIALVDVNLLDGVTGPQIGRDLAAKGIKVIFMTANPEAVAGGIPGTLGYISKPVFDLDLIGAIEYAAAHGSTSQTMPPRNLMLFSDVQSRCIEDVGR